MCIYIYIYIYTYIYIYRYMRYMFRYMVYVFVYLTSTAMDCPASLGRAGCIGARKSPAAVRHGICAWTRQGS